MIIENMNTIWIELHKDTNVSFKSFVGSLLMRMADIRIVDNPISLERPFIFYILDEIENEY